MSCKLTVYFQISAKAKGGDDEEDLSKLSTKDRVGHGCNFQSILVYQFGNGNNKRWAFFFVCLFCVFAVPQEAEPIGTSRRRG